MPERATVNQVTNVGVETVPGTAVAANRRLQAAVIELDPDFEFDTFRPEGVKFPTLVAPTQELVGGAVTGRMTYNELAYLLSSYLTSVAPTGAGPYTWTWTPATSGDDAPKTLTVERGSSVRAHRAAHVMVNSLGWSVARGEAVELDGDAFGQALQDAITLTAGATALVPVPMLPSHFSLYLDSTAAGIGGTKLTRVKSCDVELGERFAAQFFVDAAQTSFGAYVEGENDSSVSLTLEADAAAMAHLSAIRAGDTRWFRQRAVGPTPNQFTFDASIKFDEAPTFGDEDGLVTVELNGRIVHDSSAGWNKALTIELINQLAAL